MNTASKFSSVALVAFSLVQASGGTGYYNYQFYAGDNLFQNGILNGNNHLSNVFQTSTPQNTTISLWNPETRTFTLASTFSGGAWSQDLVLGNGTGVRLTSPAPFINTFIGAPLNHDGVPFPEFPDPPVPTLPPVYSGPNGIYLLGDKCPLASSGNTVFLNILGRDPNIGEQFTRLNAASQTYITSTYLEGGNWDILPNITVGESAFFNIGPIPEPSILSLVVLGLVPLWQRLRRRSCPERARGKGRQSIVT